jgi:hypothetical protein
LFEYFGMIIALPIPPAPAATCRVFPTTSASPNSDAFAIVETGIVAVTSREPTRVGFALLMFEAEMSSEVFVPLSFRVKLLTFIFADLIEFDMMLLGASTSGIEALTPDAFGSSLLIRDSMREVMSVCAVSAPPPKRTNAEVIAIAIKCFLFI